MKTERDGTLPDDLDDLLDFDSSLARAIGALGRWSCFILAENSDQEKRYLL